ncbi:MAG: hypothetical protein PF795_11370 [Kiritimatiellae bacterium]|jgi:regulator of replication initiation timing|nr:hypothetical protein [Kiritimatiellia bacterium]
MYRFWIFSLIFVGGPLMARTPPPEILKAEIQELKMVVGNLREENQRLKNRNEQLKQDVLNLGRQIQAMRREQSEAVPSSGETGSATPVNDPEAEAVPSDQIALLYVNPHWHYVMINKGSDQGINVGDYGSILRKGQRIAIIKVTDTKPSQSIAELDLSSLEGEGVYPSTADEVKFR